ncbi:MAG TPA: FGGY-family carbohydrate kinase [Dongiaceae bacterium]|nr:FGGY-family carbohydrate kinase [Dongiaceae bacterium]
MPDRLIGIDAGGTMTKAALFNAAGQELACERRPNKMLFPAQGHTERDADAMWGAVCGAIRALLEATGVAAADIAGVSVSGYGSGLYVVDRQGDPIRPGIVSTDSRATGLVASWDRDGLTAENGPRVQQRFWPGQSTALMAWLAEHESQTVERAYSVLFCKDFLRARLCGEISTDPTDGGIAGLIDVTRSDYVEEIFPPLGLKKWLGKLPPIAPSVEIAGGVTATAAGLTGLLAGTPVIRGVVDVAASALASGVTDPARMSVVAGTFSINSTLHDSPRLSKLPFLQCLYPIGNRYLATEGSATSAGNLDWFCRTVLDGEAARCAAQGKSIYEYCSELVVSAMQRESAALFFPYLFGGPGGAPAGLVGVQAADTLADIMRAIFEGVVFAHKLDIDGLMTGADAAAISSIRLAGGASRSDIWAQIFADVLGLPVEITDGSELGAQGVAICAAAAVGLHPDIETAIAQMVRVKRRFTPDPARTAHYRKAFNRFAALSDAMAGLWQGALPAGH